MSKTTRHFVAWNPTTQNQFVRDFDSFKNREITLTTLKGKYGNHTKAAFYTKYSRVTRGVITTTGRCEFKSNTTTVVETTTRKIPNFLKGVATRLANTRKFNTIELQNILLGSATFDKKTLTSLANAVNTRGMINVKLAIDGGRIVAQGLN